MPIPALDRAEKGIEELVRRIIRSAQEGVDTSRANVASNESTPDEELRRWFKNEIGSIRYKAEQALVGTLVKYHHRRAERLTNKLPKLEQYKHTSQQKTQSPARKKTVNKDDNVKRASRRIEDQD